VPPGAVELRCRYVDGRPIGEVFVDGEGRALTADGTPWPERPSGVPEDASFDENSDRWSLRLGSLKGDGELTYRYYGRDGIHVEDVVLKHDQRRCSRRFDAGGALEEERNFDASGALDGRWYRRHALSPFDDARIVAEQGMMQGGRAVSEFRFLDAAARVVRVVNRGAALSHEELLASPAFADSDRDANSSLPESLLAQGRVREALCAAARRLGRDRDRARFEALLDREVVKLSPLARADRALAAESAEPGNLVLALEGLLLGGEPARLLRLLASLAPPTGGAALELAEASLCLEPTSTRAHVTRALLRLERGDRDGVLNDAEVVARDSTATAEALRELCRVLFPEFSFWPVREPALVPLAGPEPIELDQPLPAIRRTIQLYATRLGVLRAALLTAFDAGQGAPGTGARAPRWLPPDTSFLLTDGPLELTRYAASITDENDDGLPESSEVEIDERVLSAGLGVPALMRKARAEWSALTWLCWAAGLDSVALPELIVPRPTFSAAADRATTRCFRAHDQLRSAGLVSRVRGVPGYAWEGLDIGELSPALAEIAAAEALELRSMFFWLMFADNLSPFQSDLRRV
jgi:hypothetical protein